MTFLLQIRCNYEIKSSDEQHYRTVITGFTSG